MVVGTVGCGKTTIMDTLTTALTELAKTNPQLGTTHKLQRLNPKAITTP
jgi:DNA repair exonuclease SbcCD ATPase subunit